MKPPRFPFARPRATAVFAALVLGPLGGFGPRAGAQDAPERRPAVEGRGGLPPVSAPGARRPMPAEPDAVMLSENYLVNVAVTEGGEEKGVVTLATVRSQFNAAALLGDPRHQMALTGRLTELVEGKLFVELMLKVQPIEAAGEPRPGGGAAQEFFESAIVVSVDTPIVFLRAGARTYTLTISGIGPKTPEVGAPPSPPDAERGTREPR